MNKRRRYKVKRRHAAHKAYIRHLNAIEVEAAARWARLRRPFEHDPERIKGYDDGVEYGHPREALEDRFS